MEIDEVRTRVNDLQKKAQGNDFYRIKCNFVTAIGEYRDDWECIPCQVHAANAAGKGIDPEKIYAIALLVFGDKP